MIGIRFRFARGGGLIAALDPAARETVAGLLAVLPTTALASHARYSGREFGAHLVLPNRPPRECQSLRAGSGDVIYFREWEDQFDQTGHEGVGILYGPEIMRDVRGDVAVNVIGHIDKDQWGLAEEIGLRIWKCGQEQVTIERVDAGFTDDTV